jgi:hypothetical protein
MKDDQTRSSASAVDADSTVEAQNAAQAEADRYDERNKPRFGGGGRHQAQFDASNGYKEKRTGR